MKLGSAHRIGPADRFRVGSAGIVPSGYRLLERMARDVTGPGPHPSEVWTAEAPGGARVTLSFYRPDLAAVRAGLAAAGDAGGRVAEAFRSLRHPNLVAVLGAWSGEGSLTVATEPAELTLLELFLDAAEHGETGLGRDELIQALADAARALDFLHERQPPQAHGSIRPQCFRLVGGVVKLAPPDDWFVTEGRPPAPASGPYAAPEGARTPRGDQFGLAVVYYHLRSGRPPFPEFWPEKGHSHGLSPVGPDLRAIPAEERPALERALQADPARRWPSCRAFVAGLQSDLREAAAQAPRAVVPPLAIRPERVEPAVVSLGTALVMATATGLMAAAATLGLTRGLDGPVSLRELPRSALLTRDAPPPRFRMQSAGVNAPPEADGPPDVPSTKESGLTRFANGDSARLEAFGPPAGSSHSPAASR